MPRLILNGEPGTEWQNDTKTVYWQLTCSLINTCGACIGLHMAIAEYFSIPLHRRCRCRCSPIAPGEYGQPFVDFRKILRDLPADQQTKAVGRAVYNLLERGTIKWEDAVTSTRVRPLYEIAARERLSIDQMMRAGVSRATAEVAYATVHTPEHIAIERHRAGLIAQLRGAGLTDEQIKQGFAERASKMVVPQTPKIAAGTIPTPRVIPLQPGVVVSRPVTPANQMIAGNAVLERIRRGTESLSPIPDFHGSTTALQIWLYREFTEESVNRLTKEDWIKLAGLVRAQQDMRDILKRLGADVKGAMDVIQKAK